MARAGPTSDADLTGDSAAGALHGLDAQQSCLVFLGQHVNQPVRPLPDVADALVQVTQQALPPQLVPVVVETMRCSWPVRAISPSRMPPTNRLRRQFGNRSPV